MGVDSSRASPRAYLRSSCNERPESETNPLQPRSKSFPPTGRMPHSERLPLHAYRVHLAAECHFAFPRLNTFGMAFRQNGYRMAGDKGSSPWQSKEFPLSAVVQTGYAYTSVDSADSLRRHARPGYQPALRRQLRRHRRPAQRGHGVRAIRRRDA